MEQSNYKINKNISIEFLYTDSGEHRGPMREAVISSDKKKKKKKKKSLFPMWELINMWEIGKTRLLQYVVVKVWQISIKIYRDMEGC